MDATPLRLFLAGDVMTGRGVDQILEHQVDPVLYESSVRDARTYVELAEQANGPIPRRVDPGYIWGEALAILEDEAPSARIVNLETAITDRGSPWPGKGIHYRMHPANVDVLAVAGIDCCSVANNHTLDWSVAGLGQTMETLAGAGIAATGAGSDVEAAWRPVAIDMGAGRRLIVVSMATTTSGAPPGWKAQPDREGIALVDGLSDRDVDRVAAAIAGVAGPDDLVVASIHWGPNWGYRVPDAHQRFAHRLIDVAGVDVVHGHSSHHPLGIEVYQGRLVIYGCGDLINDYEGIGGHDQYRPELGALYLASLGEDGELGSLDIVPTRMRRMRLERAGADDVEWMAGMLGREGARFGVGVELAGPGRIRVGG